MNIRSVPVSRHLGLAATAVLALGVVAAAPAQADQTGSTSPTASVTNNTLTITGTDDADSVQLRNDAVAGALTVDFGNGTSQAFDRTTFSAVFVELGRGDDTFAVTAGGQFADRALTVDGGPGSDTIGGSFGNDVLLGDVGDDTIRGSDGNDLIISDAGNDDVDGERGTDTEILGAGRDVARWLPGEGSDIVDGGPDRDALVFVGANAAEHFALSANGSRAVLTRDLGAVRMDLDGVEETDVAALAGADIISVGDLTGTAVDETNIDLASQGSADGQLDTVTLDGTPRGDHVHVRANQSGIEAKGLPSTTSIAGSDPTDVLAIRTADGNDKVDLAEDAATLVTVAVDLGPGQH